MASPPAFFAWNARNAAQGWGECNPKGGWDASISVKPSSDRFVA